MAFLSTGAVWILDANGNVLHEAVNPTPRSEGNFSITRSSFNDDGSLFLAANLTYNDQDERVFVYKTSDGSLKYELNLDTSQSGGYSKAKAICGTELSGYYAVWGVSDTHSGSGTLSIQRDTVLVYKISDGSEIARIEIPSAYNNNSFVLGIEGDETVGATIVLSYPNAGAQGSGGDGLSEGEAYILCMATDGTIDTTIMDGVTSSTGGGGGGPS